MQRTLSFAFMYIKKIALRNLRETATNYDEKTHAITGRTKTSSNRGRSNTELRNSLSDFFTSMSDYAEPHPSQIVRTKTGLELRDDDNVIKLPSSTPKGVCITDGVMSIAGISNLMMEEVTGSCQNI